MKFVGGLEVDSGPDPGVIEEGFRGVALREDRDRQRCEENARRQTGSRQKQQL